MRKITLYAALGFALSLAACKKEGVQKGGRKFDLVTGKISFKVPPLSLTGTTYNLAFLKHRLNLDSLVKSVSSQYSLDNLESIVLRSCTVRIPEDDMNGTILGQFSEMSLEALTDRSYLVGSVENKKDTLWVLSVSDKTGQELKNLFVKDTISYRLSGKVKKPVTDSVDCTAEFIYDVTVTEYK